MPFQKGNKVNVGRKRVFRKPALEKIEKFFDMSFTQVINEIHWKQKKSINQLSALSGVSRTSFMTYAKDFDLKLRPITESNKINPPIGKRNWMTGRNKDNCLMCKKKSMEMKRNNPANADSTRIAMSKAISEFFKKNPLPQETAFRNIIDELKITYVFQHPINRYVIDFFIPSKNLCIEIDTKFRSKLKRNKAAIKDKLLSGLGFKVLRIEKSLLRKKEKVIALLNRCLLSP